jgi:hypothetical protein
MGNFVKHVLNNGGSIHPLIIPADQTNGTGTFNPSVYNDNGKLMFNVRHCQVTIYHSELGKFEHEWGPLVYLNPENDVTLTTTNFFCHLNDDLSISKVDKVNFDKFNVKPIWEFIGLEDCRVFRWEGKMYLCGVRRDTTTNGVGRMELSEIEIDENGVREVSRFRIPAPNDDGSYCEKNWMPILDMPFHFLKWCNPVDIVKVDPVEKTCKNVIVGKPQLNGIRDQRGGSQVIPLKNGEHMCITHEVDLFKSTNGNKDATYRHRIIRFDKDWNVAKISDLFSFFEAEIEFCAGMAEHGNNYLITFGVTDNAAYLLRCPKKVIEDIIYG